jgi:GxxExxY protein
VQLSACFVILCETFFVAQNRTKLKHKVTQRNGKFVRLNTNFYLKKGEHDMNENEISKIILDCAFKVHSALGPGLLESAYRECLAYELSKEDLRVNKEKPMPLIYKEVKLDCGYRIDILVEDKVVIELKVVEAFNDVHIAQTLTYMKLSNCRLGLLLNFYTKSLKDGIKRLIL